MDFNPTGKRADYITKKIRLNPEYSWSLPSGAMGLVVKRAFIPVFITVLKIKRVLVC
jgi:hypothetical protein